MSCQIMTVSLKSAPTNADSTACCCGQQGADAGTLCLVTWNETPILIHGWAGVS